MTSHSNFPSSTIVFFFFFAISIISNSLLFFSSPQHQQQQSYYFGVLANATNGSSSNTTFNTTTLPPSNLNHQLASSNGTYCECIYSRSLYCTQIKLVLVPYAGHEFSSDSSLDFTSGKWIVPAGQPMPRLALEWRTVVDDKLVTEIDGALNATLRVTVGSRDGDGVINPVPSQVPRFGRYIFNDVITPLINNADTSIETTSIRLNFTTTWGPFAVSPVIEIYRRAPGATLLSTRDVHLEISQSLKNVIDNPNRLVIGRLLPDFTISIVDIAGTRVSFYNGDNLMVYASYFGLAQFPDFHYEAPIIDGRASFTGIKFDSTIIPDTAMQLTFYTRKLGWPPFNPATPSIRPIAPEEQIVTTGVFRVTTVPVNNEYFGFGSGDESFIYDGASMRSAIVNEPLSPVRIRAFDSSGRFDSTTQDGEVFLKVSSLGGSRIAFRGNTQALAQGRADFNDITFLDWLPDNTGTIRPYQDVVLFFTSMGRTQNGRMVGTTLYSMIFRVYRTYADAPAVAGMRVVNHQFYNPGFWYDRQTRYLVRNKKIPPVQIELFDSLGDRATNSGTPGITVTSDPIAYTSGTPITSVSFNNGFAIIDGLTPLGYPGKKITITIRSGSWALELYIVVLRELERCYDIRFARDYYSSLRLNEPTSFGTFQIPFRPIVVEVVDSDLNRDESCQSAIITARSRAEIGGTVAVATNGRAVFPSFSFASLGRYQVEFSAADPIFTNLTGKFITTGSIDIESTVVEKYGLEFDPNGHIRFEGHTPAIAIGETIPMIGVRVINTATKITPPVSGRIKIMVNCSRGCTLSGTQSEVVTADDGTVWFNDLILRDKAGGTDPALLVMPKLTFWAVVVNETQDDVNAPIVVGSRDMLRSGPLNVKPMGTQALALVLVDNLNIIASGGGAPAAGGNGTATPSSPATTVSTSTTATASPAPASNSSNSTSNSSSTAPNVYDEPPGFSYVGDLLIVTSLRETNIRFNVSTVIGATVAIRGPGNSYYLPTSSTADATITASSPSVVINGTSATIMNDFGGGATVAFPQAQFPDLELSTVPYIQDQTTVIEFKNPLVDDSLIVGPFQNSELLFDPSLTVIVAEIKQSWTTFSYTRWSNHLAASLKIDSDRILRARVSPGGGVVTGKDFTWLGVRVEFAFLPPTTRSSNKLSPRLLTEMFLAIADPCTGLSLRSKYALVNESECDAFRLSQAVAASKRCIETSHPALRCTCHMPFFRSMARYCAESTTFGSVCAQLTTCKSPIITDSCSKFRAEIAASYARIFGILIAVIGFLVVFGLWVNGVFDQSVKAKLETKDEAGTIKRRTQDPDFFEAL